MAEEKAESDHRRRWWRRVVRQLFNKPLLSSSQLHQLFGRQPAQRTTSHLLPLATFLICFSEGEIEGFPSARDYTRGTDNYNLALLKDVYLTDTPVLRSGADVTNLSDSDYNFKGVTVKTRYGTNAQTYISSPGLVRLLKTLFLST
jgi:hypothetical protein